MTRTWFRSKSTRPPARLDLTVSERQHDNVGPVLVPCHVRAENTRPIFRIGTQLYTRYIDCLAGVYCATDLAAI